MQKNYFIQKMLNSIMNWDFNPEQCLTGKVAYAPGVLTIHPISLVPLNISTTLLQEVVEANITKEFDLLNNGSYPLFDGDSGLMLCGNRAVAHALVDAGVARLAQQVVYHPVYYNA